MYGKDFWLSSKRPNKIQRIVSCVPSQTEFLFALGLDSEIVGVTLFCVHPSEQAKTKTKIGGTKNLKIDKILALKPDLVIGNKEENTKEQLESIAAHIPVFVTDVHDFNSALHSMNNLSLLVERPSIGEQIVGHIQKQFFQIRQLKTFKVIYLIWHNPWMTVGGDTFINSMLNKAGFINCFEDRKRYPEIDINEMIALDPDFLFLSSEPFPFRDKHEAELVTYFPPNRIKRVDGELFSWYGNRMSQSVVYFSTRTFL